MYLPAVSLLSRAPLQTAYSLQTTDDSKFAHRHPLFKSLGGDFLVSSRLNYVY